MTEITTRQDALVAKSNLSGLFAQDALAGSPHKFRIKDLSVYYGDRRALRDVTFNIPANEITALIGPSGCGKSTFLRCLNRMNDIIDGCRVHGRIALDSEDLYGRSVDPVYLRARVGMVFQKPNPFPKSIYDNIAYGPRIHRLTSSKKELDEWVLHCLDQAGLLQEVRDRLDVRATELSGGQQQRLCIARTIAVRPDVILMDEPCSALDPIATAKVEELMLELVDDYTIVIVTHNMQQARRVSSRTAFFHLGEMVEDGETEQLFLYPEDDRTLAYVSGKIG